MGTDKHQQERLDPVARWTRNWKAWVRHVRSRGEFVRSMMLDRTGQELMGDVSLRRVVDLGCGEGRSCRLLSQQRADVLGVDIVPEFIEEARATGQESVSYLVADLRDAERILAEIEEPADIILANLSLNSVPDFDVAINAVASITRPGGCAVVVLPHPCFLPKAALEQESTTYGCGFAYEEYFEAEAKSPVLNFHRPLSIILSDSADAGLNLIAAREPLLAEEDYHHVARAVKRIRAFRGLPDPRRVPWFICLKFIKRDRYA